MAGLASAWRHAVAPSLWQAGPAIRSALGPCIWARLNIRIHGTNKPDTIGKRVSSGCIRLINEDVADLYERVKIGVKVIVLPVTLPLLLDRLGPPGFRFNNFGAPRLPYLSPLYAREGADGQAVVCPLAMPRVYLICSP